MPRWEVKLIPRESGYNHEKIYLYTDFENSKPSLAEIDKVKKDYPHHMVDSVLYDGK